jgi:hypothetical protein
MVPKDAKLTTDILASKQSLHALAERAIHASDVTSRTAVYSELIQSRATCHALHGDIWGPAKP